MCKKGTFELNICGGSQSTQTDTQAHNKCALFIIIIIILYTLYYYVLDGI